MRSSEGALKETEIGGSALRSVDAAAVEHLDLSSAQRRAEWTALVEGGAAGSTFCHHVAWADVLADALGHEPHYLAVRSDDRITAILPTIHVRSRLFGDYLLSMPFLNYGGPAGDPAAAPRLAGEAIALARTLGVDLLELRTRESGLAGMSESNRKLMVWLDLPDSATTLWDDVFRSKLRGKIKRPMKEGMETRFGVDQLDAFYSVFARNMRDLGTPVLPRRFFDLVAERVPGAMVGAVYHQGEPVAAGFGFLYGTEFEMTWASSLRESNTMKPNMLLYWDFMQRVIENGGRLFNFGRSTPGSSTHDFKLGWGGYDQPLPWAQWSPGGVAATPSPDRPVFRAATAVWSRLPLAISNRLGPLISPSLP